MSVATEQTTTKNHESALELPFDGRDFVPKFDDGGQSHERLLQAVRSGNAEAALQSLASEISSHEQAGAVSLP